MNPLKSIFFVLFLIIVVVIGGYAVGLTMSVGNLVLYAVSDASRTPINYKWLNSSYLYYSFYILVIAVIVIFIIKWVTAIRSQATAI